jgi:peptide-methionine (S)-S-oxide reductase
MNKLCLITPIIFIYFFTSSGCEKREINAHSGNKNELGDTINMDNLQIATFGSGCFWCTEAIFERLNGVVKVESGYSGGKVENPTYEEVCTGTTGHAEVTQITYDPSIITFDELLEVFWKTHDPTTLNRQGNDAGTQYRSVIFYHNEDQKKLAEKYKAELDKSGVWDNPIVTEISPFINFYSAEKYHQDYYNNNPNQGYCTFVITPKVEKFEKIFKDKLKK